MSGMRLSWEKVLLFIFFFTAASLLCYGRTLAANENSQEGAHASSVEAEQSTGGYESGHAEGEGHGADRKGDLRDLTYRIINFVLLVIILVWALKKANIKSLFSKRIEDIRLKLETLRDEKNGAEKKYHDIDTKLKAFEKERIEILAQYRKEGEAEKEKIIAEANLRVQQIIDQAEATIEQELQSARDRLKHEVVNLAAQKAQEIIAREINDEDQDRLIQDFIERVGKIH